MFPEVVLLFAQMHLQFWKAMPNGSSKTAEQVARIPVQIGTLHAPDVSILGAVGSFNFDHYDECKTSYCVLNFNFFNFQGR